MTRPAPRRPRPFSSWPACGLAGSGPAPRSCWTLGAGGAVLDGPAGRLSCPALSAGAAVDTTGAGDTFIGYFLAARLDGAGDETCLRRAAAAAALCVTRPGARDAIPHRDEVDSFLEGVTIVKITRLEVTPRAAPGPAAAGYTPTRAWSATARR